MKKKKEFRKLDATVAGMLPLTTILHDIPEPDPGKMDFKRKEMMDARKFLFQGSDLLSRLVEHLGKRE